MHKPKVAYKEETIVLMLNRNRWKILLKTVTKTIIDK